MTTTLEVPSITERLRAHVGRRAARLQDRYHANSSVAVADLALLRRGIAQKPGSDLRLVELTIAGLYPLEERLPDAPTAAEHAAYTALTLFALHQQSKRSTSMHNTDYPFGRSARILGRRTNARDAVRARFNAVATATSWEETVHHARGLISQFRAADVPLDYAQFAVDLLRLQSPASAERVRLTWGRDFYRVDTDDDASPAETGSANTSDN